MQERERKAWVCTHKNHGDLPVRIFLLPGDAEPPKCPEGHRMTPQPNRPYMQPKGKKK
jgi:hypothetical protein